MEYLLTNIKTKHNTIARTAIHKQFNKIHTGLITINDPCGSNSYGNINSHFKVTLEIKNMNVYSKIMFNGGLGFADSYIKNQIETTNLTNLIRIFIKNREIIDNTDSGFYNLLFRSYETLKYLYFKNKKKNAKSHILRHYDLSNEFFSLMLDETMTYSAACFKKIDTSLQQAAKNKIDISLKKLNLTPSSNLLEIGSGWGSMAIAAAKEYGCKVTTTTISDAQYNFILKKIQKENLQDKIKLLNRDYRDLQGKFDRLISIEMIEAVGYRYYKNFFKKCDTLISNNGLMLLQAILIRDNQYERAKKEVDFIKKQIFPGSCIPSMGVLMQNIAKTNFCLHQVSDLSLDYVLTLKHWLIKFNKNIANIRKLNFDDRFIRCWQYYLCYCIAGFMENAILDKQLLFAKGKYFSKRYYEISNAYF